ncbi:MAG: hypothetical protein ABSB91_08645 [Sedimentisphaerales bacterium]
MTPEKRKKTAKILSLAVILAGFTVIIGWFFDIRILKSIAPAWVSMKFDTAIAFVLSGITLYFIVRAAEGEFDKAQVALSITSLLIILLMGTLFFSAVLEIRTGAEDLFIKEAAGTAKTVTPGRPSMPTMVNFLMVAAAGILTTLNPVNLRTKLRIIGLIIGSVSALAIVGYIVNKPVLYYYIEGINSAVACHTAALFMVLGIGFLCL